jgi:hypothetical protein
MLRKILAASSAVVLGLSFQGCSSSDGGGDGGGDSDSCNPSGVDTSDEAATKAKLQECYSCLTSNVNSSSIDTSASTAAEAFANATCDDVKSVQNQLEKCGADSDSAGDLVDEVNDVVTAKCNDDSGSNGSNDDSCNGATAEDAKLQECISCLESKSGVDVDNDAENALAAFSALTCAEATSFVNQLENCGADEATTTDLTVALSDAGC